MASTARNGDAELKALQVARLITERQALEVLELVDSIIAEFGAGRMTMAEADERTDALALRHLSENLL